MWLFAQISMEIAAVIIFGISSAYKRVRVPRVLVCYFSCAYRSVCARQRVRLSPVLLDVLWVWAEHQDQHTKNANNKYVSMGGGGLRCNTLHIVCAMGV